MSLSCIRFLLMIDVGITIRELPELCDRNMEWFVAYGILMNKKLIEILNGKLVLSKRGRKYLEKLKKVKP